ncbi:cas scaffolding protein family member 4-like isoform X2 [Acipenser oxyrinchus oxyrinchus]|uniref:Cas scaffolding protein family member 4-like isoform X2 n=1 Tax=Acipenser oxyrinchus oxyrinchus TaxID=40147 RepID=A0AAD8CVQ6_ACIOX|nr:cas scaffolding protein family member 4-like isoform X2 [Acipenser oxyrinchus oxyrinchus]
MYANKPEVEDMENLLAKALYDNKAECSDELAFRKGDILTVIEQNVAGSEGWWRGSLYGRQGLAPANRLHLLSFSQLDTLSSRGPEVGCLSFCTTENPSSFPSLESSSRSNQQNIYQIPCVSQPAGPAYEDMNPVYKVPSLALPAPRHPSPSLREPSSTGLQFSRGSAGSSPQKEVYDVPTLQLRASLTTVSAFQPNTKKSSMFVSEREKLEQCYEIPGSAESSITSQGNVYAAPPVVCTDSSYDIPVSSMEEAQKRLNGGYSTLPNPRKSEWIYDIPVSPEKQSWKGLGQGSYETMPAKGGVSGRQQTPSMAQTLLYDIPTPSTDPRMRSAHQDSGTSSNVDSRTPRTNLYDTPPAGKRHSTPHPCSYDVPPSTLEQGSHRRASNPAVVSASIAPSSFPVLHRGAPCRMYDLPRGSQGREDSLAGGPGRRPIYDIPPPRDCLLEIREEEKEEGTDSQHSSTASSSSSGSSCDPLPPPPLSAPKPHREVTLSQEEAVRKLSLLQEGVCQAVSRLMVFISSRWRAREYLTCHLEEVRSSVEAIAGSLTSFLDFAADMRGNASRLRDCNLQARLQKQLVIVEDSGVILLEAGAALAQAGWKLDSLAQDPSQAPPPDSLDRFVMVARTVPEDVKRLVSILNANSKLLFRPTSPAPAPAQVCTKGEESRAGKDNGSQGNSPSEDSDYVQLQRKEEFEKQQKNDSKALRRGTNTSEQQVKEKAASSAVNGEDRRVNLKQHCKLYFGALQKAIAVFITSLVEGQPPEKFISHSKLVIMVGQKLVDTLCKEAHSRGESLDLLYKSNLLCALLKQLAVTTKKAAVHFPDTEALLEAQDFAKELAQRAQHFRTLIEL